MTFRISRSAACALMTATLIGCGGSGGGSGDATSSLNAGVSDLSTVLSQSSTSSDPTPTLKDASARFKVAYGLQPSGQAAIGYSVAQGALDANSMLQLFGKSLTSAQATPAVLQAANSIVLWKTKPTTTAFPISKQQILGILPGTGSGVTLIPRQTSTTTPAQVIAQLKVIETDLNYMLLLLTTANIQGLETNPLTVSYKSSNGTTTSIKIGSAEGFTLRTGLYALKGIIDALLAYNLDYSTYNWNNNFYTQFGSNLADGKILKASDYLPPAPFLNLNSDGSNRLKDFKSSWLNAASDAKSSVTTLQGRSSSGWLYNLANYSSTDLTNALADINVFTTSLSGPIPNVKLTNVNGDSATVTVDIGAWTGGNPPTSLRSFFPDLQSTNASSSLSPVMGSISDPTYGGLVSGGVPSAVLYDRTIIGDANASFTEAQAFDFLN